MNIDTIEFYARNAHVDCSLFKNNRYHHLFLEKDGVIYNYFKNHNCLKVFIKPKDIIDKIALDDSDYDLLATDLNSRLLFNLSLDDLILNRIDYCNDYRILDMYRTLLLKSIFPKTSGLKHKVYREFDSTIYYNQKQSVNCIYDKELEQRQRFGRKVYADILRFEVRLNKKYLSSHKKYIPRTLKSYWNIKLANSLIYKHWRNILFIGDYYNGYYTKAILNDNKVNKSMINKLIEFRSYISNNGVERAKQTYGSKFYSYKNRLEELKINPIQIPKNNKFNITNIPGFLTNSGFNQHNLVQ